MSDLGFHLPKEHGFTVIFICSIIIGILISFKHPVDLLALSLILTLAIIIFFSNTSIIQSVKSKFHTIHIVPFILIAIFTIITLLRNPTLFNLILYLIMGVFFISWMLLNFMNRGHTTEELVIGTLTITLFVPLLFINTTYISFQFTQTLFIWILAIWWLVSGFTSNLILYVQYMRRKLSLLQYNLSWLLFILTTLPFYYVQIIPLSTIIVLLEPTLFIIVLTIQAKKVPVKPVFKKIGQILTFRMIFYILLLSIIVYL